MIRYFQTASRDLQNKHIGIRRHTLQYLRPSRGIIQGTDELFLEVGYKKPNMEAIELIKLTLCCTTLIKYY